MISLEGKDFVRWDLIHGWRFDEGALRDVAFVRMLVGLRNIIDGTGILFFVIRTAQTNFFQPIFLKKTRFSQTFFGAVNDFPFDSI